MTPLVFVLSDGDILCFFTQGLLNLLQIDRCGVILDIMFYWSALQYGVVSSWNINIIFAIHDIWYSIIICTSADAYWEITRPDDISTQTSNRTHDLQKIVFTTSKFQLDFKQLLTSVEVNHESELIKSLSMFQLADEQKHLIMEFNGFANKSIHTHNKLPKVGIMKLVQWNYIILVFGRVANYEICIKFRYIVSK